MIEIGALDSFFVLLSGIIFSGAIFLQSSLGNLIEEEANLSVSTKEKEDSKSKKKKSFLRKRKN
ncbi:hypothetical protein CMESO_175 (nucleomorph) [Chroomonas mesostigmatica CCMP1168]|uniref:Uncharacterized protein n=1 Tax=Chroomonas mesostigmatica CCMP1168 TaxID=1195612 RepID=J7G5K4_9CRYP|nr:hypothetical protein CMESO_175 [Chroomonas mesostigmatica CCMP1168]